MSSPQFRSIEDAWEELTRFRVRLRDLQKDVRRLGEKLFVLSQEVEAARPKIIVTRLNGDGADAP